MYGCAWQLEMQTAIWSRVMLFHPIWDAGAPAQPCGCVQHTYHDHIAIPIDQGCDEQTFDELLLLKRGGHTIYAGPLGHESAFLIAYFQSIPGVPHIHAGVNPATWM